MKILSRSFAGGELAPELYGRVDLDKFQNGLATCKNFITLPHGPAQNRAGFAYLNETKYNTKKVNLIEFSYSTTQTYILEFGDQYIRFHTNGATLLESSGLTITGLSKANPGVLNYTGTDPANGDTMYLAGIGGMTQLNGRYVKVAAVNAGANTFQLTDLAGSNINTTAYTTYTSGGTATRIYEVASPYLEADLFDIHYVQSADVLTLVHPNYAPRELKRLGAANWTLTSISFTPTQAAPTGQSAAATVGTGSDAFYYKITAIASDGLEESIATTATGAITNNLSVAGNFNTISWSAATGALRYNVYKFRNGLYGYMGQTTGTTMVDNNITADVTRTPPEVQSPFSGAGNYPSAVSYFEQRRCFGGTDNKPHNLWMTRSATESNLNYSIPTQDDDAIALRVVAREVNRIRHIIPLSELLLLTSSGEWRVTAQNSDALTPASTAVKPQAFNGAQNVQPVMTGNSAIYVRAQSSRVHDISYSWESNAYKSSDISLLVPHLLDDYNLKDMTLSRTPVPIVWLVRSDGVLLGLTYMPDQKVWAWHQHDTSGGLFESVAAVSESDIDVLYAVVKRTINGRTVRYIERMGDRRFATLADAFVVDAGATYSGTPVTTISGLWHLEGELVSVLADGAVLPQLAVEGGTVVLPQAASKVQIGLPISAVLQPLPMAVDNLPAAGQGRFKNINKLYLRVYKSSGIKVGPDANSLTEYKQRTTEPYGSPPDWISGEIEVAVTPSWNSNGQFVIQQDDPLPLTVLSYVAEVAFGG